VSREHFAAMFDLWVGDERFRAEVADGRLAVVRDAKAVEHFLGLFTLPEPFASAA
jgi:hypothetical protein